MNLIGRKNLKSRFIFGITAAILISVILACFLPYGITHVYAIESKTLHDHTTKSVTWSTAPVPPNNAQTTAHQHHCNQSFGGLAQPGTPFGGHWPPTLNREYEAYSCWDNEVPRPARPLGGDWSELDPFIYGHGFIEEWTDVNDKDTPGVSDAIPDYYFSEVDTNGVSVNWPDDAKARIRDAFNMWGNIDEDRPNLVTGIAFEETQVRANAEILIYWQPLDETPAGLSNRNWPLRLFFNSSPTRWSWYYGVEPYLISAGELHFFSYALHEGGHVVGLCDQADKDDVMYYKGRPAGQFESIYRDVGNSGNVSVGDVRLTSANGYPAGTTVNAADTDINNSLLPFAVNERHTEWLPANGIYDVGENIYLDLDGDSHVSAGDVRLRYIGPLAVRPGTTVETGDGDICTALVPFLANEKHTGDDNIYDTEGPWFSKLDPDSEHGVRDLYSIPAPDFGDAPDPKYPSLLKTWMLSTAARHFNFTFEWLGDGVDGEIDSKQINMDKFDDGVTIVGALVPGSVLAVTVDIRTSGALGRYDINDPNKVMYLNGWIDWNGDGDWKDTGEKVIGTGSPTRTQKFASPAKPVYNVAVPTGAKPETWMRIRLDYAEDAGANPQPWTDASLKSQSEGAAGFGEVEDWFIPKPVSPPRVPPPPVLRPGSMRLHYEEGLINSGNPLDTQWHELYPQYCRRYRLSSWEDNGDGVLSPCDQIDLTLKPDGPKKWYHVDEVTVTIKVTKKPELVESMYIEFEDGYLLMYTALNDPVCTYWHEAWPDWCGRYHLSGWLDNGDGVLSFSDQITLRDRATGEETEYHVDEVATDIILTLKKSVPVFPNRYALIAALVGASGLAYLIRRQLLKQT